jgi:trimeric autotransporter adhesin
MTLRKIISASALFAIATTSLLYTTVNTAAAGVTSTVSPSTSAVSTSGTVTLAYTTASSIPSGSSFVVSYDALYTGTASVTIDGTATATLTPTTSGGRTTLNMTSGSAVSAGSVAIVISGLTSPTTAGNYSWSMRDTTNFSTVLQYVGQANVVNVRAFVPVTMSFAIRNSADTANTNVCELGDQSLSAYSLCDYRLRVATNAKNGYSISYQASGDLTDGTYNVSNAAVGATGNLIDNSTAGTEKYGVTIDKGSVTAVGGVTSLPVAFDAGATNAVRYNDTASTVIMSSTKGNAPNPSSADTINTVKVTHKMNIDAVTPSGFYTADYTYTVTPSF